MTILNQSLDLLGQQSPNNFMSQYWQKKPLLIRQAIKDFKSPISINELISFAQQENIESRLIKHHNGSWQLEDGPFHELPTMEQKNWTLLVQSVDLHHQLIAQLASLFDFIPQARFDDIMISIASQGGGVGPHFDSYDVFLLQAQGKRHWKISDQEDKTLIPNLPCRILKNFQSKYEWTLEPGDMLYLPPNWAHDGVALNENCMTISIGFRTLSSAQLVRGMLEAAADQVIINANMGVGLYSEPALEGNVIEGYFKDPNTQATQDTAKIPSNMIEECLQQVKKVNFDDKLAIRFLGCWLTEPNPISEFHLPEDEIDLTEIDPDLLLCPHPHSRLLYREQYFFINGDACPVENNFIFQTLANQKQIKIAEIQKADQDTLMCLHQWLDDGWLILEQGLND